ncbi:MAG: hypothetical protein ABJQ14_10730, partial [Hyphomicrobiales bacterium]
TTTTNNNNTDNNVQYLLYYIHIVLLLGRKNILPLEMQTARDSTVITERCHHPAVRPAAKHLGHDAQRYISGHRSILDARKNTRAYYGGTVLSPYWYTLLPC